MTPSTRVRCAGCRAWYERTAMLRLGLGWVCSRECQALTEVRRAERVEAQIERRATRQGVEVVVVPPHPPNRKSGPSSEKKLFIRERDGKRCRMCGTTYLLHVHHVKYRSEGGGHDEANLITLCLRHHDLVHSSKRYWQPILLNVLHQHYELDRFVTVLQAEREMHPNA